MDRDATPTARVSWQGRSLTDAVLDVEVEDHDRLSDRAVIELSDPGGMIASIVLPGHSIAVELGSGAATTTVFTGIVRGSTCHTSAEYGDRLLHLALEIDRVMHERAPAGWKGDQAREAQVLNALFPLLDRNREATLALFELVKSQPGY